MIDDGVRFIYKYDAWGRMTEVSSRTSPSTIVSKYRYNGLGFRIGWQYHQAANAGGPGIVDADPWFWLVYNDKWQQIAAYRVPGSSGNSWANTAEWQPKEVITHHMAGFNGSGGSSYIDSVVMRERDNQAWGDAVSSWSLTGRQYLLQNWRADVVLATDAGGSITDRIRYSAYGEPQRYSLCDLVGGGATGSAPNGALNTADLNAFTTAYNNGDPLADIDGDGIVDGNDFNLFINEFGVGAFVGTGVLSADLDSGFRRGYAGYEFDPVLGASYASVYHVRNRVYDAENGRWNKRDPLGYVDGMGLYEYCGGRAMEKLDEFGLQGDDVSVPSAIERYPDPVYPFPNYRSAGSCRRWAIQLCKARGTAGGSFGCIGACVNAAAAACEKGQGLKASTSAGLGAMSNCNGVVIRTNCFGECMSGADAPGGPCYWPCAVCSGVAGNPGVTLAVCLVGCGLMLVPGLPAPLQQPYHYCVLGCVAMAAFTVTVSCPACAGCLLSQAAYCANACY